MDRGDDLRIGPVADTEAYRLLKSEVLGSQFPWYWREPHKQAGFPLHCHTLIERPEAGLRVPKMSSPFAELAHDVVLETCEANGVLVNSILRMAVNATERRSGYKTTSETHVDHEFDHRNLLIYLTDADGATVVGERRHEPEVDTAIFFTGSHYHELPTTGRRIVLVTTYI